MKVIGVKVEKQFLDSDLAWMGRMRGSGESHQASVSNFLIVSMAFPKD